MLIMKLKLKHVTRVLGFVCFYFGGRHLFSLERGDSNKKWFYVERISTQKISFASHSPRVGESDFSVWPPHFPARSQFKTHLKNYLFYFVFSIPDIFCS